jgi:hypothetical protein
MSTDRPMACSSNNSTPTTTMTRTKDEPKVDRPHHHNNNQTNNHDIAATVRDQPDEMSTHSNDNTNNIAEDEISTNQQGQERSGNIPQPKTTLTTPNHTVPTHTENPIQSTCPTTVNYTPHKKHGVGFEAIDGLTIEQYLRIVADNIGGINIKYASRLSGGRICTSPQKNVYKRYVPPAELTSMTHSSHAGHTSWHLNASCSVTYYLTSPMKY